MKKYPFLEAIGTADEKFLEEVFEDKNTDTDERRSIIMNKKRIVSAAIAAVLVFCMAVGATAAVRKYFFEEKKPELSEYSPLDPRNHYYGSVKDGTAYEAKAKDISFKFEETENGELRLVMTVKSKKAPYKELTEYTVTGYLLYKNDVPEGESPMLGASLTTPETLISDQRGSCDDPDTGMILEQRGGEVYIVKGDGKTDYILEIIAVSGYRKVAEDWREMIGNWLEIHGDWVIEFTA